MPEQPDLSCPQCGSAVTAGAAFCIECGATLSGATSTDGPVAEAARGGGIRGWWGERSGRQKVGIVAGAVLALAVVGSVTGNPDEDDDLAAASSSPSATTIAETEQAAAVLTIDSHEDGDTVDTDTVQLRGTAPAGAEVVLDLSFAPDKRTSAETDGSWVMTVDLDEGPNDLVFRIGSDSSTSKTIRVTYTPATAAATATPEPTVTVNLDVEQFEEFTTHVALSAIFISSGLNDVSDDALAFDVEALQDSSIDLWLRLGREVQWLASNPPASCFAAAHSRYGEAIDLLYESMDLISDGAILLDAELLEQGSDLMLTGSEMMEDLIVDIEESAIACG